MSEKNTQYGKFLDDKRIPGAILLTLLVLSSLMFVKMAVEIKSYNFIGGGVPVSNTITMEGTGEVFAVPDIASFSFSVTERRDTVKEAQNVATGKINNALLIVKNAGVEDKDIKTTGYNVYPRYDYIREACTGFRCPPGKRELTGYEVSQTISVKVRDTEKAGEILSSIGDVGVSNVSGLSFTIDDEDDLLRQARAKAITDAKEKAKELARDLDVRLVRVVSFSEQGAQPYYRSFDTVFAEGASLEAKNLAPEIPTGENKITSRVNVTYEIR